MSNLTASEARGLMEAYNAVYTPQEESLEQEIFEAIACAFISQGCTATDVLEYFAQVDEDVIIEDLVALSEGTLLIESVVSDEYIKEQMQQLDEIVGLLARGAMALARPVAGLIAKGASKVAQKADSAVGKLTPKKALPPAGATGAGAKNFAAPVPNLLQRAGGALRGAVQGVKGAATKVLDKLPGGSQGKIAGLVKGGAKLALGGAAFEAGMRGAGALMGGKGQTAKTSPSAKYNASAALGGQTAFKAGGGAAAMKNDPKLSAADIQRKGNEALFKAGGGKAAMGGKSRADVIAAGTKATAPKKAPAAPAAPFGNGGGGGSAAPASNVNAKPAPAAKPATGTLGKTPYQVRTPNRAEFKAAQEYRAANPNAKPEDVLKAAQEGGKRQASVDTDLAKANTPAELNKKAPPGSALAKEQERREEEKRKKEVAGTTTESYDAYDVVLEYLVSGGHVESVSEAHYVMLEMDAKTIQSIVEAQYARENPDRYEREQRSRETRGQSAERRVRDRLRTMDPEKAKQMKAQMRAVGLNV